ncbi:MAG: ferredoxin [Pseudomonadota bacterium]
MDDTRQALDAALARSGLAVVGAFHPRAGDGTPEGTATLALIGPDGARLWPIFAASPEAHDGQPHPLDRWSKRVLAPVAAAFGARALYPFEGPPWQPFLRWAARGEGTRTSPVKMAVSPTRGLWTAYRGALALSERLPITPGCAADPCLDCAAPCLDACPVAAFAGAAYDVPACAAHALSETGRPCREGCLVRRACPLAPEPPTEQRRFHMRAFLAAHGPLHA